MSKDFKHKIKTAEVSLIREALKNTESITAAARYLGLKRTTLFEKMKRYKLDKDGKICQ